jgi:hypothetical protein
MDWARAVYDDPANREGLHQSVLRSALRSSPAGTVELSPQTGEAVRKLLKSVHFGR